MTNDERGLVEWALKCSSEESVRDLLRRALHDHWEMSYEEKKSLTETRCVTLDGKPAVICGALKGFAKICQVPHGLVVFYPWVTVSEIVCQGDGHFKS